MSDFLDTQVGSMNFKPPPRPKGGGVATPGTPAPPAGTPHPATTTPPPSGNSLSFAPTYQDYLAYYGKGGDGAFSEAQWNGLGAAGQWSNLGGGFAIGPDDPRYSALAQQLGITDGGTIVFGTGTAPTTASRVNGQLSLVNPGSVLQGDGVWATAHSNLTPEAQFSGGGLNDREWVIAALSVLGGGAALGTALGGEAGVAGAAGASGAETVPEVLGPDGAMLPPGGPELTGPPVAGPAFADPTVPPPAAPAAAAPPPGADLQIPPPMEPVTAPTLDPMVPYTPAGVADGLTPGINNAITLPPEFQPSPGGGLDYSPTLPGTPDFNVPPYSPPNVDVPPPDFTVDQPPWWQAGMDAVTSHPLQAAGLGISAFNAFNRPKPPTIDSHIPETNKPVVDQAISDIMHKGALSGDQQHSIDGIIDQHIREGVEAINQRAINSGMGANSMVTQQQINQFKQNAEVARAQLYQQQMQQNISNAISVWAEGNREDISIQTAAANLAMQNNQEISRLNQSISQSLGWLYSMSNSRSAPSTFPGG